MGLRKLFVIFVLISKSATSFAQDPMPSHYLANPLMMNPSYTGGSKEVTATVYNLNSYPGLAQRNSTFLSLDVPIEKLKGGLGVLYSQTSLGDINIYYSGGFSYAYAHSFNEKLSLRASTSLELFYRPMDIVFVAPTSIKPATGLDLAGGLILSHEKFSIGTAIHHINEPDISLDGRFKNPLPKRISLHGAYTFTAGKIKISPNFLFLSQEKAQQYLLGLYIDRGIVYVGSNFSHTNIGYLGDAASFLVGGRFIGFNLGYSYSITVSKLKVTNTYGRHELFLRKSFGSKKERKQAIVHNPLY